MALTRLTREAHVTTVTMCNSPRRNALGSQLVGELLGAIEAASHNDTRVLVIRAERGVRTWSDGHDVTDLPVDGADPLTWTASRESLLRAVRNAPTQSSPLLAAGSGAGPATLSRPAT